MKHRRVLTRDGNRMNRHIRRQHDTTADTLRYGLSLRTRLTFTLFLIRSANDRILLIHGAGDFHGGGHGCCRLRGWLSSRAVLISIFYERRGRTSYTPRPSYGKGIKNRVSPVFIFLFSIISSYRGGACHWSYRLRTVHPCNGRRIGFFICSVFLILFLFSP